MLIGVAVFVLRRKKKNTKEQPVLTKEEPTLGEVKETEQPKEEAIKPQKKESPKDFIVMRLIAEGNRPYASYELLQTLFANGLRFGDMDIFHRHQKKEGEGPILFSLASALEPGTFDIQNMGDYSCQGLTIFMKFDGQQNLNSTFDLMLETARQLADDLGGKIFTEDNKPLNDNVIEAWHGKIKNYEDSKYSYDLFEGVNPPQTPPLR